MREQPLGRERPDRLLHRLDELEVGDYTIVHVGFAITKLDEESALETLALFEEIGMLGEELGVEEEPQA